ncbi:catechol 2,3-dioxygenase-like lactoylglutathione lyase family enzyme [Branchiibius hedensis]|uniref:Catechol 2,3-dioxygenase n=1 Tax=Branchiibius hedensis TaxID=672460 RepID=A0A2Y9BU85_9MICO|nr:VOC family protein [Branchiibius hedensis]PWJ26490.1 catechol 2,3-dioxygenase-like lactoylglutathione lyase family enzyme [Branchiibius hedensis]SSA35302.1 Catechol 2,3-dioxygenase [Branchiibius hedensis]
MSITISSINVWVHDQEVALDFWTTKVGFELRSDWSFPEMPGFRWLTVGPKDQPDIEIVLMSIPGAPVFTDEQHDLVEKAMSTGLIGAVFLVTDDVRRDYAELSAKGVEFYEKPEERPYGIDCGFRDPSGNMIRLAQMTIS